MTERVMPGLGLRSFYDAGQEDWGDTVSEDLRALSVIGGAHVASRTIALPASGSAGDIYIVPTGAHADEIAVWDGPAGAEDWVYLAPTLGCHVFVEDEATNVQWTGSAWDVFAAGGSGGSTPYDIRFGFGATPAASQVIEAILIVRDVTIPADFAGSLGSIGLVPVANMVLSVQDDGVEIGTVTIGTDGFFTFATTGSASQTVLAGTLLTLVAPAVPDASAANAVLTLLGSA